MSSSPRRSFILRTVHACLDLQALSVPMVFAAGAFSTMVYRVIK